MLELFQNALLNPGKVAIVDNGIPYTYQQLLDKSAEIATCLLQGKTDLQEERIAFILDPSFLYVATQWGIWRAGGIAVPLCVKHPYPSIAYVLQDTSAHTLIYSQNYYPLIQNAFTDFPILNLSIHNIPQNNSALPSIPLDRRAMILYTSGTTGKPKGVVSTHKNILAQIKSLVLAWEWSPSDHLLNILPLHHVHGIINALCCPLYAGASCEFLQKFDEAQVVHALSQGKINVFMAVPTIYYKLIQYIQTLSTNQQELLHQTLLRFRLMVSGSAALPISTLEAWKKISGHTLLERYGMTEMGMAISNPLHGERRPGSIGMPLPQVLVRLADDETNQIDPLQGEIQIKGDNVFLEYWNKAAATQEAFVDGWFKTGDMAVLENNYYRILGRNSVDIIKTGGYKVSALEIEEILRNHPHIKDCGVVGIPNEEWGEIIGVGIIPAQEINQNELNSWLKTQLPNYKMPRKYLFLQDLPRNVMGKVTKNELLKLIEKL